jgi:mRNA-degrading endonuclease RelE of RelBE toxin-antitoxin system
MYAIEFTQNAVEDLECFRTHERRLIVDSIQEQLSHEPGVPIRNRKPLQPNDLSQWELRVGSFRVFYDVLPGEGVSLVMVKAIGKKEHNSLYIRGKEYRL